MRNVGNWRTVNMTGTIAAAEVGPLRVRLACNYEPGTPGWDHFGPLSFSNGSPSLCGLNNWVRPEVSAVGNLAERDYSPEDVRAELEKLLAIAPSMMMAVHCGGDWESDECVATIRTGEGLAVLLPPEVERISGFTIGNLMANLARGHVRPLSSGGLDTSANKRAARLRCNVAAGDRAGTLETVSGAGEIPI
jgi:hypothetical protein